MRLIILGLFMSIITACAYGVDDVTFHRAENLCRDNGGLYKMYQTSPTGIESRCNDGLIIKTSSRVKNRGD